ncbi:MAG: hypothetical protein BRD49_06360 [Bacteroidetes bacterium SW_10_40_5]|nr:MAG: hypothetical protein BRD49_06360 [Bacteroidetes bacterium SW_10_40_5]
MKDWKESQKAEKEASHKKVSKEIQKQRKYLEDEVNQLQNNLDRSNTQKQQDPNQLAEGDRVKLKGGSKHGKVEKVMKNKAMIIFDNLKTEAALKDLVKVDNEEPVNSVNKTNVDYTKYAKNFEAKIDVRGKRRDEALKEVEDWLDKAVLLNQHELRILHGKGNGILKSAIKEMLQKYNFVKNTYHENPDYGGEGITIVELSQE